MRVEGAQIAAAEVETVDRRVSSYEGHAGRAHRQTSLLSTSFGRLRGAIGSVLTGGGLLGLSLGLGDAVKNALNFQSATTQLGVIIHNRIRTPARDATEQMIRLADSMAVRGGFGPAENIKALTGLIGVTGSLTKTTRLFTLATDIARGTHSNLARAVRAVMMVEAGRMSLLSRMGIILPKHISSQQALILLQERFGGATAAANKTAVGAMTNFTHALDIVGEKLGMLLLPILTKVFTSLSHFVDQVIRGVGPGRTFRDVLSFIGNALKIVWQVLKAVGPELLTFIAAWWAVVRVQRVLSMVMSLSPINKWALIIAGIVAVMVLLYRHSAAFRNMIAAIGEVAKPVFTWLFGAITDTVNFVRTHWSKMGDYLTFPFRTVAGAVSSAFDAVKGAVISVLNWAIGQINVLINAYNAAFGWLTGNIHTIGLIGGGGGGAPTGTGLAANIGAQLTQAAAALPFGGAGGSAPSPLAGGGPRGHRAQGGPVDYAGVYTVGERGSENVFLPAGAYVQPHGTRYEADVPVLVHIDGYQVGHALARVGMREKARGA